MYALNSMVFAASFLKRLNEETHGRLPAPDDPPRPAPEARQAPCCSPAGAHPGSRAAAGVRSPFPWTALLRRPAR